MKWHEKIHIFTYRAHKDIALEILSLPLFRQCGFELSLGLCGLMSCMNFTSDSEKAKLCL